MWAFYMVNLQLAKPIIRIKYALHIMKCTPYHRTASDRYLSVVGSYIGPTPECWYWSDIKMTYSTLLYRCKMKYLSVIEMANLVSATEFHILDKADIAISDQHRGADIEVISKWHIHVGFTNVEIRYLSDIEWRCFGKPIPSYFCRFRIGCYIDPTYSVVDIKTIQNGIFVLDLPIQMSDIDGWYRVLNAIALCLYRLISTVISVGHHIAFIKTISKWRFS